MTLEEIKDHELYGPQYERLCRLITDMDKAMDECNRLAETYATSPKGEAMSHQGDIMQECRNRLVDAVRALYQL